MNDNEKTIWFPAKENGWGWGKPKTWQGWTVLVSYVFYVVVVSMTVDPKVDLLTWGVCVGIGTSILMLVYYVKGEAPSWKWKPIDKEKRKLFK